MGTVVCKGLMAYYTDILEAKEKSEEATKEFGHKEPMMYDYSYL